MSNHSDFEVYDGSSSLDNLSVAGRIDAVFDYLERAEKNLDRLAKAAEGFKEDQDHESLRQQSYAFNKQLLMNIEVVESQFPDLLQETEYHRLRGECRHLHWRLEEGYWEEEGSDLILGELKEILEQQDVVGEIRKTLQNALIKLNFNPAIDDFEDDFQQAKDLIVLEKYDTAIFVLCRACEQAQFILGEERNIQSIELGGEVKEWDSDDVPAWARNEALYNLDQPDGEGKMIQRSTRERFQRVFTELRNDVAHLSKKEYDRERGIREVKNLKELLLNLSKRISEIRGYEGNIAEINEQTVNHTG